MYHFLLLSDNHSHHPLTYGLLSWQIQADPPEQQQLLVLLILRILKPTCVWTGGKWWVQGKNGNWEQTRFTASVSAFFNELQKWGMLREEPFGRWACWLCIGRNLVLWVWSKAMCPTILSCFVLLCMCFCAKKASWITTQQVSFCLLRYG